MVRDGADAASAFGPEARGRPCRGAGPGSVAGTLGGGAGASEAPRLAELRGASGGTAGWEGPRHAGPVRVDAPAQNPVSGTPTPAEEAGERGGRGGRSGRGEGPGAARAEELPFRGPAPSSATAGREGDTARGLKGKKWRSS